MLIEKKLSIHFLIDHNNNLALGKQLLILFLN